jgi:hypothetical protein
MTFFDTLADPVAGRPTKAIFYSTKERNALSHGIDQHSVSPLTRGESAAPALRIVLPSVRITGETRGRARLVAY